MQIKRPAMRPEVLGLIQAAAQANANRSRPLDVARLADPTEYAKMAGIVDSNDVIRQWPRGFKGQPVTQPFEGGVGPFGAPAPNDWAAGHYGPEANSAWRKFASAHPAAPGDLGGMMQREYITQRLNRDRNLFAQHARIRPTEAGRQITGPQ